MMFLLIFISSSLLLSAKKHSIIYLKNYKFCISSFILESKPKSDTPLSVTPTFYYLMYEKHLFIKNWKGCKSRKNSRLSTYTLVPGTIHCKLLIRKMSCITKFNFIYSSHNIQTVSFSKHRELNLFYKTERIFYIV